MPSYLVGVVVFFKPLYHIFIVMFVHRKILKPREMVSRSALAYLHIRWNDLPFRRVEKISEKIWQQGKSLKVQSFENTHIFQEHGFDGLSQSSVSFIQYHMLICLEMVNS